MAPCPTDLRQLGIRAWCTNRHLPIQMLKGVGRSDFTMDVSAPVAAMRLFRPTVPRSSLVLPAKTRKIPRWPPVASPGGSSASFP